MKNITINEQIRSAVVVLISATGEKKGQFTKAAAIQMARNEGMDLVQVSQGTPPVCKIADYGKLKYKASKAEKHTQGPQQKEVWLTPKISQADADRKFSQASEWLKTGHKVMLTVKLKGREKFDDNQRRIVRDMLLGVATSFGEFSTAGKLSEGGKATSLLLAPKNA